MAERVEMSKVSDSNENFLFQKHSEMFHHVQSAKANVLGADWKYSPREKELAHCFKL